MFHVPSLYVPALQTASPQTLAARSLLLSVSAALSLAPVIVGLLGYDQRSAALEGYLISHPIDGRPFQVRKVGWAEVDDQDSLRGEVHDTGIGTAEEDIKRLFQPFIQVDSSATRRHGGTGLGLAISERFCKLMGGKITLQSTVGVGSTFTVHMPVA